MLMHTLKSLPRDNSVKLGFQQAWASLVAQLVMNPPTMWETWVQSLGWKDPLEKGKATHSSILAWRIPWTAVHGVTKSRSDKTEQLSKT